MSLLFHFFFSFLLFRVFALHVCVARRGEETWERSLHDDDVALIFGNSLRAFFFQWFSDEKGYDVWSGTIEWNREARWRRKREREREKWPLFLSMHSAQCAPPFRNSYFHFSENARLCSSVYRCFGCFGKHKLIGTFPFDHFFCPSTVRGLRMPWNGCDTYPLNGSVTNWICIFSSFFCFEYSNSFNTRLSGLVRVWVRENWKPIIFRDFNDCEQFMAFDRSPQATTTCLSFEMFYGPKLYFEHWLWSRYPLLIEILLASRCSYKHFS